MTKDLDFKHYLAAGVIAYAFADTADYIGNFSFVYDMVIYCIAYTIITYIINHLNLKGKSKEAAQK